MLSSELTIGVVGTNVQTTNEHNESQVWEFSRNSDGSYGIINIATGKALTLSGGAATASANVCVEAYTGSNAQAWFLHQQLDGTYIIRPKCASMYVLDILGASGVPGANVQTYLYNGTKAQSFTVTLAFSDEERAFELNASSGCVVRENEDGSLALMGITPGTTISDLANILNHDYVIYDADGASVSGKICTGYVVKKLIDGTAANSAVIIVMGDSDGDGVVTAKDVLRCKKVLGGMDVNGYKEAFDCDLNGQYTKADLQTVSSMTAK